jgi:multicomponent Na+:H+ antiporter subunit B
MTAAIAVELVLMVLIVVTALAAVTSRSLLAASMLLGIYSLLVAAAWIGLHAPDVAFTEAAVGAGVSTVFFLAALVRTGWREKPAPRIHWPALAVSLLVAAGLALGVTDLPELGDPNSPANTHVGAWYLDNAMEQTHVPNVVTAVLASYRGFDTMFETAVIFTGGAAVLLLLRSRKPKEGDEGAA